LSLIYPFSYVQERDGKEGRHQELKIQVIRNVVGTLHHRLPTNEAWKGNKRLLRGC
jgi:hypothetical protein